MDILDVDSLLNDDSFCLTEEKIYDDVTNIIKQWKINNVQNVVFDSRTFTRPKQKVATNLEPQLKNYMNNSSNKEKIQIGGLVTQRQQHCFLGNISPPNSKYCSLDLTTNQMFNSLITSADFSNITFLSEEQLPTATSSSKTISPDNLKKSTLVEDSVEEIGNTFIKPDCKFAVHNNLDDSLLKDIELTDHIDKINYKENVHSNSTFNLGNTFEKRAENEKKIKLVPSSLDATVKISDETISPMLLNETFYVEGLPNSPETSKLCKKFNNLHIDSLNTSCLGTPENNNMEQNNIFAQSTPQVESGTSLVIHLSPISSKLKKNTEHVYDNAKSEKNSCENNLKKLLYNIETKNNLLPLETKSNTTNLFQDHKSSQNANINQSLDAIKKRFSNKIDRHVQNNIILKENSDFSPRTERLLNKRGTIYDNNLFKEPENIYSKEKFDDENKMYATKFDKEIEDQDKNYPVLSNIQPTSNNKDQYKTMKIVHKTNKELNNSNNIALETGYNSRFTLKNKNSPIQVVSKTDNIPANKIFKGHLSSTYISKTNSASELEHSVCQKDCATINKLDIKNNMGLKAKSFHNLSSNNFGYSKNVLPLTDNLKQVSSDDKLREVRPATVRRTGLIRPSTGIYSKAVTNNKDAAVYKPKTHQFDENPATLTDTTQANRHVDSAERNGHMKDTIKHKNEMIRKPRLLETRVRSNSKESGHLRHSSIPKK